ncbi:hypothetical protein DITRI_Ditri06bG0166800 [Diplodiscus trichospermus]
MISCWKGRRHENEGNDHPFFIKNGGVLLKELVALSNGKPNPIRHFSAEELLIATNYYDTRQSVVRDFCYRLYKGYLKDIPIFVKKYDVDSLLGFSSIDPYKDIAIGSQMSAHKNVLKVLGCCLETEIPTIVYEYAGTKTLSTCISPANVKLLPWKCRLKVAVDIANAIAYLHTAFDRPVIHRDINCYNIILDKNNVPKLIDFGQCIFIPEGQTHVDSPILVRMDGEGGPPEYIVAGNVTEKYDVYCFGTLLVNLFIGDKPTHEIRQFDTLGSKNYWIENFSNVFDPIMTDEGNEAQQLLDIVTLSSKCMCKDEEKRPTMIEVGKELRRIHQSF